MFWRAYRTHTCSSALELSPKSEYRGLETTECRTDLIFVERAAPPAMPRENTSEPGPCLFWSSNKSVFRAFPHAPRVRVPIRVTRSRCSDDYSLARSRGVISHARSRVRQPRALSIALTLRCHLERVFTLSEVARETRPRTHPTSQRARIPKI